MRISSPPDAVGGVVFGLGVEVFRLVGVVLQHRAGIPQKQKKTQHVSETTSREMRPPV